MRLRAPPHLDNGNQAAFGAADVVDEYGRQAALTLCEDALFRSELTPGIALLDLGVGAGRTTPVLSALAYRYVGIDYAPAMVAACRERFPELDFRVMDAADLAAFADASFDAVVFSFNGFDYVYPREKRHAALQEWRRVLRSGGTVLLSCHNARSIVVRPKVDRRHLVRTLGGSLRRGVRQVARVGRWNAFWRGEGYVMDPTHGGLLTWFTTPTRFAAEARRAGFELRRVLPSGHPRPEWRWEAAWFYYVLVRN